MSKKVITRIMNKKYECMDCADLKNCELDGNCKYSKILDKFPDYKTYDNNFQGIISEFPENF